MADNRYQQPPPREYQSSPQYLEGRYGREPPRQYARNDQPYDHGQQYQSNEDRSGRRYVNYVDQNGYSQNGHSQSGQWHNESYQEQYQRNGNREQHYQDYDQAPQQGRAYQYDERYRTNDMNGRGTHQQNGTASHGGHDAPRSKSRQRNVPVDAARKPQQRERILVHQPESPQTVAWDNPFGAFPGSKKDIESKKRASQEKAQNKANSLDGRMVVAEQRPSTSHSQRPRVDDQRPQTSHSQRPQKSFEAVRSPQQHPAEMPLRKDPPRSGRKDGVFDAPGSFNPQSQPGTISLPSRPAPQRSYTGPVAGQQIYEMPSGSPPKTRPQTDQFHPTQRSYNDQQPPLTPRANYEDYRQSDRGRNNQEVVRYDEIYDPNAEKPFASPPVNHDEFRHNEPVHDQPQLQSRHELSLDTNSYRGVPMYNTTSKEGHSDVPNFAAMTPTTSEKAEDHFTVSSPQEQPAYQKQSYRAVRPEPVNTTYLERPQNAVYNSQAPLNFAFELPDTPSTSSPVHHIPPSPGYQIHQQYPRAQQSNTSQHRPPVHDPYQGQVAQYPPRGASRADQPMTPVGGRPPFPEQYSSRSQHMQGYPQRRSEADDPRPGTGLGQPLPPPRQDRDFHHSDYGQEYAYDQNVDQRNQMSHRQNQSPNNVPPNNMPPNAGRSGFDHRLRNAREPGFNTAPATPATPAEQQFRSPMPGYGQNGQPDARPRTANSTRPPPVNQYEGRASSDAPRKMPDSLPAHPLPVRPGLANPPAAPPLQPPQPNPAARPQEQVVEQPVTVAELNMLRESYKNNPNDNALGLRFGKKLVEAAKVLASENGRADAKQTAKNRERYILDGHRVMKKLVSAGYPEAMFHLADCHGQGLMGLQPDPKEAYGLYVSAGKLGHAQSAYRVAVCCELGTEEGGGTRRDPMKAVQWYKRAASLGDTAAMYKMGMIQLKGLLGQQRNPREAIPWLKRAAERADKENPHALHELGLLYESAAPNDSIVRDENYSRRLFLQAADLGYKYSQFRLGSAYEYGTLGCAIDARQSIAWYTRAASQGEHQSEFALSGWYLTGSPPLLEQSDTEAYLWARKAASSGLAKAEYAMGYFTEVGIGVTANVEEAKRWYYRAAAQNHAKARERLEELKRGGARMQKTRVSRSHVGRQNEGECSVM